MTIAIQSISKRFGANKIFEDASLTIPPGKRVALLGANGAGKTTLLRCLATLSAQDSGDILFDGELLARGRTDLRRRFMFMPDFPDVFEEFDALDLVAMHIKLWEAKHSGMPWKAASLLNQLGLSPFCGVPTSLLSRGQRYKAVLAALITVDPDLWMFDEPFASGMDPEGIEIFRTEVDAARERNRTIIYSTQMVEQAADFSDLVVLIKRHSFVLLDTDKDLERNPRRLAEKLVSTRP